MSRSLGVVLWDANRINMGLPEGCLFKVEVLEHDDGRLSVGKITPDQSALPHVMNRSWQGFINPLKESLGEAFAELEKMAKDQGKRPWEQLEALYDEAVELDPTYDEDPLQLLTEF